MRVRLHVTGSLLCDATDEGDHEAFEAVLDSVSPDPRVHRSEIEILEIADVESGPEEGASGPVASVDVGAMTDSVLGMPTFREEEDREEFEREHGLEVFDCSTWPDDLLRDLVLLLDRWSRDDRSVSDSELCTVARGLGLIGPEAPDDEEGDPDAVTDRGRLLLLGYRCGARDAGG